MSFFNGEEVDENDAGGFAPLPAGNYRVYIDSAETKQNKNNGGFHVSVTLKVVDGEYNGRLLFQNFNIENNNETAQKIGKAQFKKMLIGIGAPVNLATEDQMKSAVIGKVVFVKVGQKKRKDTGDIENTINDWSVSAVAKSTTNAPPPHTQADQPAWG
jgi:hypothetical protein